MSTCANNSHALAYEVRPIELCKSLSTDTRLSGSVGGATKSTTKKTTMGMVEKDLLGVTLDLFDLVLHFGFIVTHLPVIESGG